MGKFPSKTDQITALRLSREAERDAKSSRGSSGSATGATGGVLKRKEIGFSGERPSSAPKAARGKYGENISEPRETNPVAKEPKASARSAPATSGRLAKGSIRPVAGRSATATSEIMDATGGESAAPKFDRLAYQREYMRNYRREQKEKRNAE